MRLFFAVLPDAEARSGIAACRASRSRSAQRRALVPPENYHVTLAFVGEVAGVAARDRARNRRLAARLGSPFGSTPTSTGRRPRCSWRLPRDSRRTEELMAADSCAAWRAASWRSKTGASAAACNDCEEGVASACAASNVCIRLEGAVIQPDALEHGRRASIYTVLDTWPLLDEARKALEKLCRFRCI